MPTNQNQLTPSTALRTAGCLRVRRRALSDSGNGFQLIARSGAEASTRGMARLIRLPVIASATMAKAAASGPYSPAMTKINPPKIMPSRMDIEVPISTRPLPPVSSSGLSTLGRIEYFTGPNRVDCRPVRNSATSSTGRLSIRKPTAAIDMMPISIMVVMRTSSDFSSFSATWPASPEKRK